MPRPKEACTRRAGQRYSREISDISSTAASARVTWKKKGLDELTAEELQDISPQFNGDIRAVFDPFGSVCRKKTAGSTHPDELKAQIAAAKRLL